MIRVAHRGANTLNDLAEAAAAGIDLIEGDVHLYRGRLEMRHGKWLGPRHLWDRGGMPIRRRDVEIPLLGDVLGAGGRLMLDLKGVHPGLAPAVAAAVRTAGPVWVCTQHWWMLHHFAGDPGVQLVLSAGSHRGVRRLRAALNDGRHLPAALRNLPTTPRGDRDLPTAPRGDRDFPATPRPSAAARGGSPVAGVSVRRDLLTPALVAELHDSVPTVLTWPVDTPAELEDARRLGVSGVISKNLPLLRAMGG